MAEKKRRKQSPMTRARRVALARQMFPAGPDHPASLYNADTRERILRMYRNFAPVKEIMKAVGCSRDTVNRYVRAAGVPKRRRPARFDPSKFKDGWELVDGKPVYTGRKSEPRGE